MLEMAFGVCMAGNGLADEQIDDLDNTYCLGG